MSATLLGWLFGGDADNYQTPRKHVGTHELSTRVSSTYASSSNAQDATLLARIHAGDISAFETVFRTRAPMLIRFAERVGVSRAQSEDVVTDVFAAVWQGRDRLDLTRSLDAYLFRAVRNAALNALRSERRESDRVARQWSAGEFLGLGVSDNTPDELVERASALSVVEEAVQQLPERQRTVIYLRYTRELSLAEIADAMETSVPAVKNMLQRAHRTLRTQLGGIFDAL